MLKGFDEYAGVHLLVTSQAQGVTKRSKPETRDKEKRHGETLPENESRGSNITIII